jgi:hypothetical protein
MRIVLSGVSGKHTGGRYCRSLLDEGVHFDGCKVISLATSLPQTSKYINKYIYIIPSFRFTQMGNHNCRI